MVHRRLPITQHMVMPKARSSTRRLSLLHVGGNVVPMVSGIVTAPLTARAVGVQGRGQLAVIVLVGSLAMVAGSLGMGWYARDVIATGKLTLRDLLSSTLLADCLLVLPALVLTWGLGRALNLAGTTLIIAGAYLVVAGCSASRTALSATVVGAGWLRLYGLGSLFQTSLTVALIILLFIVGQLSVSSTLVVLVVGILAQMIWNLVALLWHDVGRRTLSTRSGGRPSILRAASILSSQIADVAIARSDLILVSLAATSSGIGFYSVVALIPQVGYQVANTLMQQSFASLTPEKGTSRLPLTWGAVQIWALTYALLSFPVAWFTIPIVFGDSFAPSRAFLGAACVFAFGASLLVPVIQNRAVTGSTWSLQIKVATAFCVMAASSRWLGLPPRWGLLCYGGLLAGIACHEVVRSVGSDALRPRLSHLRSLLQV